MTTNILYFGKEAYELDSYFKKRGFEYKNELISLDTSINEPESIETHFESYQPSLQVDDSNQLWAILVAGNAINFGSLSVLEKFDKKLINVVYIIPDMVYKTDFAKKTHKIVYNVLQEYARSGKFRKISIFDLVEIEKELDNLNFENDNDLVLDIISYVLITDYDLDQIKPIKTTVKEVDEAVRIQSYGLLNIETNKEKKMFDIKYPREVVYRYIVGKDKIKEPLFRKNILNFLKTQGTENTKALFDLFEIEGQNLCLVVRKSSLIQN